METTLVERISADPNYKALIERRGSLGLKLSITMLVVYYGYILLIAFGKGLLSAPIGRGVMTWGIPIGFGVIIFTVLITAVYVRRANREFDELAERVRVEALK